MTQTTNYGLNKPQGSDLFAPLTDYNPNWDAIDEAMYDNQLASVPRATEAIAATVHNITRNVPDAAMFRFTATGNVSAGDTFTVDGIAITAIAANGQAITAGAWLTGTEVLACLNGNVCTFYVSAASSDAETLQGHAADYFGTAAAVEAAQQTATAAGNVANQASIDAAAALAAAMSGGVKKTLVWSNSNPGATFPAQTVALQNVPDTVKFFIIDTLADANSPGHSLTIAFPESTVNILGGFYPGGSGSSAYLFLRIATLTQNSVTFTDAKHATSTPTTSNTSGVPFAIYAVA